MKTTLINDVPRNIKAFSFYGEADIRRIKQLESDIENLKKEIYRLQDIPRTDKQDTYLAEFIKQLSEKQKELNQLKKLQNPPEEEKSNYFLYGLYIVGILLFLNRKKR